MKKLSNLFTSARRKFREKNIEKELDTVYGVDVRKGEMYIMCGSYVIKKIPGSASVYDVLTELNEIKAAQKGIAD